MKLTSPAFDDGGDMPSRHARDGGNASPPLYVRQVPEHARSLVLIVEDIDSPIGPFTHRVVWNMLPDTEDLREGSLPQGAQTGLNGFGETGYCGPCPPSGRR